MTNDPKQQRDGFTRIGGVPDCLRVTRQDGLGTRIEKVERGQGGGPSGSLLSPNVKPTRNPAPAPKQN